MQVTNPTYILSKEGKVIMEVTATSVERAQDYFYESMPESYSYGYIVHPKPIETPK